MLGRVHAVLEECPRHRFVLGQELGKQGQRAERTIDRHAFHRGNFSRTGGVQTWMVRACLLLVYLSLHSVTMAQTPQPPNVDAQRAAMKKLGFLVGQWSGEATVLRASGSYVELSQTEVAKFKLDGLVLMIEGVGRTKSDGKPALEALGFITFDDTAGTYRMRAFNDGRWLESEVKLLEDGHSLSWGFTLGDVRTKSALRMNEKGEWTEIAELIVGARPPQKLIQLTVRRLAQE